jgi:AraC family transcriptional regulator
LLNSRRTTQSAKAAVPGALLSSALVSFIEDMNRFTPLLDTPEVAIGRFDHPSDHPHHDSAEEIAVEYSVNRVERGKFSIQVGRRRWTLGPGHVFLCYPGMAYRCYHDEPIPADSCVTVIYREESAVQEGSELLTRVGRLARKQPVLDPTNRSAYVFRNITAISQIEKDCLAAESYAAALLDELFGDSRDRRRLYAEHQLAWYAERVDVARALLHRHYASEHRLPSLARTVGMSTFHFARIFSELAGASPHRYLQRIRLNEAARRLIQGDSVTEACFSCGFRNLSHFIRAFARQFGASPGKYKLQSVRRSPM